jgi:GNAT superfamily N-acetyltransferase
MGLEIEEIGAGRLGEYARIPISFLVETTFEVEPVEGGLGGMSLREREVPQPWVKDYDACEDGGPEHWPEAFGIGSWGIFLAVEGGRALGGAAVAYDTPEVHILGGRRDLAALWDLRVEPDHRRRGVGTELFRRAAAWSQERGCTMLKIETQNVNVPACRFYAKQGGELREINRQAYAHHPKVAQEVMLVWYVRL